MVADTFEVFINKIFSENLPSKTRQDLLKEIKNTLEEEYEISGEVCSYISNTINPAGLQAAGMNITHEVFIYDILRDCRAHSENLVMIVVSPGGDIAFLDRLVRLIKVDLQFKEFTVIAPHIAKSATTLLALVADKVIGGPLTQFGPIDPQIPRTIANGVMWVSARQVKDLIENTLKNFNHLPNSNPQAAVLGIYGSIDWMLYQQSLDAIELVKQLVDKYHSRFNSTLKIRDIKKDLIDTPLSHSQDISPNDLKKYRDGVIVLEEESKLWKLILEYYTRALRNLHLEQNGGVGSVLFETSRISISTGLAKP